MIDRLKLFDFIDDNINQIGDEGYQNIYSLISSDVSDEELMSNLKKYGVDKLKGFETEILGKEDKEQLSDVPTNISSDEYDEYVKLRNPNESSKRAFGQKVIDDSADKSKELSEQRKKDVEEYSNVVKRNPYEDMYKNERITAELNDYDVNDKVNEYMSKGLSKSKAYDKVRKDIKEISNQESTSGDVLKSRLLGFGQYLLTPKMAEDYYVQTGKYDDAEARTRAGLGTALNALEMHPTYGIGKVGKALVYAGKPVTEAVRTNVTDSDEADVGGAIKDAAMNTGLNVLFDVPQILPEVLKQQAGLGGILEKAKPVQSLLEGIQEADKIGSKKPLASNREELRKVYKDYFDIDVDKIFYDKNISKLKSSTERQSSRAEALKNAMNERIPDITDRDSFKKFQTRTAKGIKELEGFGENLDAFDNRYLYGKQLDNPLKSKTFNRSYEADRLAYEDAKKYKDAVPTKDDIDALAEIYDRTFIKHPRIAKVTKSGVPSGLARGVKSDSSENDNKVKSYVDYLKNDELALRMWKAGFTPHDLTKEQKEKINDLLRE